MARFTFSGDVLRERVADEVSARLERAGAEGVRVARSLVPVATGRTRDSIGFTFDRSTLTLRIHAGTPWAVFIELGTSRVPARPFLRPALVAAARAFGGGGNVERSPSSTQAPPGRKGRPGRLRARLKLGHGRFK